ncbi:phage major capsid protein [Qipengyuania huizhouensis]|uniref:phage major capsid protein n=1 Tax=Qipengyuania huizhouensis TaxID=2867245 RepID=UPI001C87DC60|nr:phage major capsid protein [Qipengyuania huizhouensis]MBX7460818.1 phage major capsid protein [Qipengyuania huizhouensis]
MKMNSRLAMLAALTPPRAMIGAPRAETDTAGLLRELNGAFADFKAQHQNELRDIEASLVERIAGSGNITPRDAMPTDPEYSTAFASYFRKGDNEQPLREANATGQRLAIQNAMSTGTNSDGGYLAPVEWDRRIQQRLRDASPMRSICQVQTTSNGAFTTLWNSDEWGTGWVGETAARPQTTTASLSQITFEAGEIYAMPAATQRLLDDSAINFETWLADSIETEFAVQEDIAFISGDGSNKPRGLLTFITGGASDGDHPGGNLATFNSESATDIPDADTLLDFKYQLAAPYRANARWLMNSQTAAFIAKMKTAQGDYIWREGLIADEPATLLGRPVTIDEAMPDIGGDALPIAFGDFQRGYLINDRLGTRVLRDPYTAKPFVLYYTTRRVGGGLLDPNAIKLMKIAVTV